MSMETETEQTLTIQVPLTLRKRGGRKVVLSPAGEPVPPSRTQIDSTLVKALARAFRWQRMLETGNYASVADLAAAEKIHAAYLRRVLRLTLLAPTIVEDALEGRSTIMLADLMDAPPALIWDEQVLSG
jgi:hypothetical protein